MTNNHDTIQTLHEDENNEVSLVPETGHSTSLCSNKTFGECPVLGFDQDSHLVTDEILLDSLVDIVADIYLANHVFNIKQP